MITVTELYKRLKELIESGKGTCEVVVANFDDYDEIVKVIEEDAENIDTGRVETVIVINGEV